MSFEMKNAECLRYHIWLRIRQYIDQNYDFCKPSETDLRRSHWVIINIFFGPDSVEVRYLDPGAVRVKGEMTGGSEYLAYNEALELRVLKEMADYVEAHTQAQAAGGARTSPPGSRPPDAFQDEAHP